MQPNAGVVSEKTAEEHFEKELLPHRAAEVIGQFGVQEEYPVETQYDGHVPLTALQAVMHDVPFHWQSVLKNGWTQVVASVAMEHTARQEPS